MSSILQQAYFRIRCRRQTLVCVFFARAQSIKTAVTSVCSPCVRIGISLSSLQPPAPNNNVRTLMPELRQNFFTKELVIIATERARKPEDLVAPRQEYILPSYVETCPFRPCN